MDKNKSKSSTAAKTTEISDSEDEKENKGSLDLSWSDFLKPSSTKGPKDFNKCDAKDSNRKQPKEKVSEGQVSKKNQPIMKIDEKDPLKVKGSKVSKGATTTKHKPATKKFMDTSDESDDNLDDFLAKFTNKKKSPDKKNDEDISNFIVADDEVESDEFSTPKLSLRERIMKASAATEVDTSTYRSKTQIPDSDSDDELPELEPSRKIKNKSRGRREKPRLPSSKETSEDDSKESGEDEDYVPPILKTGTSKKTFVIESDSDNESDDNNSPYYSDDPVNIYEPGQYHNIPPPSSPPRPRAPVPKSIYRPPSPTPVSKKSTRPPPKTEVKSSKPTLVSAGGEGGEFDTPTVTFLSSLSEDTPLHRCHPEAKKYKNKFNTNKEELAKRLFQLYNTECFDSCLPQNFEISWNVRLTKTAGLCYSRRYRDRHGIEVRSSRIELSTKVIDSCDRLRDTLIHEMCHAASWIISGYRDGHGPLWKTWASKAMARFPELPVIGRCHSYAIRTKYTYKCVKCGYCIGRHSKSLDTNKKVCGHCYGTFQLVVNYKGGKVKESEDGDAASAVKTANPFALYVQENYKSYKKTGVSHGDVMKLLGDKFKEVKISNK